MKNQEVKETIKFCNHFRIAGAVIIIASLFCIWNSTGVLEGTQGAIPWTAVGAMMFFVITLMFGLAMIVSANVEIKRAKYYEKVENEKQNLRK